MSAAPLAKKSAFTYELQSSVKGLAILQDGIMGAGINLEIEGRKDLNEIMVTAPHYATRKIRFYLEPGRKKIVSIELAKLKYEANLSWKNPFKRFLAGKLEKKTSICNWYQNKAQEKIACDRISYLDDIFYADDSIFKSADLRDYQKSQELNSFRSLLAQLGRPETASAIEDFFAKHPDHSSAFHLASLYSLVQGDCPRVYSLYTEAQQSVDHLGTLRLHMAVCAEASNNAKLRDQIISEGLKEKYPNSALNYWAFQIQLPRALPKASEYATACLKAKPLDLRCQEAMSMASNLSSKTIKLNAPNLEEETFKNFMNSEEKLPKGGQEILYLNTAAQLENFPHSLESYLLMSWINAVFSKDLIQDYYIDHKVQIAVREAGSTLDKIVEAIEKNDLTQLLPPIYLRRLRFQPDDPNLWYRLIRSFAKAKQCKEMLTAIEQGNEYLPKYNTSLLQMKGSCELEQGRNKEALTTYAKIMEVNPKVWSSPYNLANIHERMGNKKEALTYFKRALDIKPPADVTEAVKLKILQLQPAASP